MVHLTTLKHDARSSYLVTLPLWWGWFEVVFALVGVIEGLALSLGLTAHS